MVKSYVDHSLSVEHLFTCSLALRSILNAQFPGKSISVRPSCLSAVYRVPSRPSLCGNSSHNLARSSTRPSCSTARRGGARVLASSHSRTSMSSPCSASATFKSTASWYVPRHLFSPREFLKWSWQIDVKLAQPRSQREGFVEPSSGTGRGSYGNGGGSAYGNQNYSGPGNATASGGSAAAQGQTGSAAFDPQALAQLYTRMITQIGGMNPMMGGMNPAMMGGQYGGMAGNMGMRGGMAMGGGQAMGMGRGVGIGAAMGMQSGPGSLGPNVPRGPRNAPTGPSGGVGPQRAGQRGQHSYHPYAR